MSVGTQTWYKRLDLGRPITYAEHDEMVQNSTDIETVVAALVNTVGEWQDSVKSIVTDPSTLTPLSEDRWLIGTGAIGVWAGLDDQIAEWDGSAWVYTIPKDGFKVTVDDDDISGNKLVIYHYEGDYPAGGWQRQTFLETSTWSDVLGRGATTSGQKPVISDGDYLQHNSYNNIFRWERGINSLEDLWLTGQVSGKDVSLRIGHKDGDGSDKVNVSLYGYGNANDFFTHRENMVYGWDPSDENYFIHTQRYVGGAGLYREIELSALGTSGYNMTLETNGDVKMQSTRHFKATNGVELGWDDGSGGTYLSRDGQTFAKSWFWMDDLYHEVIGGEEAWIGDKAYANYMFVKGSSGSKHISFVSGGTQALQLDSQANYVNDETALAIQVDRGGVHTGGNRISIGAVDSGGVGYRVLRILN